MRILENQEHPVLEGDRNEEVDFLKSNLPRAKITKSANRGIDFLESNVPHCKIIVLESANQAADFPKRIFGLV
jgi:hypothetical protein